MTGDAPAGVTATLAGRPGCALHGDEPRDDCPRCHASGPRTTARLTAREAALNAAAARARRTPAWAAHIAGTLVLGGQQ